MNAEDPQPVVAAVDGTDSSRQAAEWAGELASAWRAPLHLVHATGAGGDQDEPVWLREVRDAAACVGVEQVESRIVTGPAVDVLVASSHGADMLVVGSFGEGSTAGMLAGSVALALLEAAQCPIAVVRGSAPGSAPPRCGPILVGTDAASADDAAARLGARLADSLGCRLTVLHAWSDVTQDATGLHRAAASGTELAIAAVHRLEDCLGPLRKAYPEVEIDQQVVGDTALRALLSAAAGARMIVVGHQRGPRTGGRLGSTSRGLVGFAHLPVIVV